MKRVLLLLVLSLIIQTYSYSQTLAGTWVYEGSGMNLTMLLNSDGSGEFQGMMIKYKAQNGQLYVDDGVKPVTYSYKLTQNSLVLSGGGLQAPVTFKHPGGSQENISENASTVPAVNRNQNQVAYQTQNQYGSGNQSNINRVPSTNGNQGNMNAAVNNKAGNQNGSASLSGLWQGPGGKMAFYPDGTMLYNSVSYNYSFTGGQLSISGNDGSLSFSATLAGNTLSLSQNGNSAQYTRIASASAERVDPQLVGKWCIVSSSYNSYSGGGSSSEECITLNADGTYIYSYSAERSGYAGNQSAYGGTSNQNGDQGTWKTDGITITSTSRTTGKVSRYSFSKENSANGDPMIVIGGKKFVTAYNRPRW